jgi:hypothetical protein
MKVGAESRTKLIALAVLLVGAAISVFYMFSSMTSRPAPVAAAASVPNVAAPQPRRQATRGADVTLDPNRLDPELDLKRLEISEGTKYEGSGRNIFVPALEEIPKPVAPARPEQTGPPPPPPPPPINLKFFGFATHTGEGKRIFLSEGDNVFIGGEGEIVDRRYKIVRINPNSVEIEDVLNNNRQTIPLSQS